MAKCEIIVIGAGAAGLLAAGEAAGQGAKVTLLERMKRPGRKLSITGKGRCNLTNDDPVEEFIFHFGRNGRFLRQAFDRFFSHDLVELLGGLGVPTTVEQGGRIFPESEKALDVVDALTRFAKNAGAVTRTNVRVTQLLTKQKRIVGVHATEDIAADAVIIATGGVSYPATGSSGDGYQLARQVGHTIAPVRPSLVPVETGGNTAQRLQGLSLRNVAAKVLVEGKKKAEEFGEMLFTHFGLSGPIILRLSRVMVDALQDKKNVTVSIDLKPALSEEKLDARLLRDIEEHGKRQSHTFVKGLLPGKLLPVCMDLTNIAPDKPANQLTAAERMRLRTWLKDFRFEITGHRPWEEAIITAGGVSTKEIDPRTMASRLVEGLYFAGEVIDIDGSTGGYNLQAAFSTGWLAGHAAGAKA
ncbi:MAG: NAD(P)/FAD-dependent oxidoreductase [bacterium]|nr:NAD(P)/FAD-dependent oxidoreductase [bacterium]